MKNVFKYAIYALLLLTSLQGCSRMELYELSTQVNLKVDLNLQINSSIDLDIDPELDVEFKNKINGIMPEHLEVMFYDVKNNSKRASFILPANGGTINIEPGDYNIVAYSFGTESTQVGELESLDRAKAFTTNITETMASKFNAAIQNATTKSSNNTENAENTKGYEDDPIIHEPDHLYVANEKMVNVPSVTHQTEDITIHATAQTIIDICTKVCIIICLYL